MRVPTAVFVLALALAASAESQTITAHAVKAAFVYNFATFAVWPADALPPGRPIAACVLGENAMGTALRETIKGRAVGGHAMNVYVVKADSPLFWCHVLYVSGLDEQPLRRLLESLKDAPVFTVGDGDDFAAQGGVAQLILENARMRFAINVAAAHRARLTLSSRLLSLATIVKDANHAKH